MQIKSYELQMSMRHAESASLRVQARSIGGRAPMVAGAQQRAPEPPMRAPRDTVQWSQPLKRSEARAEDPACACDAMTRAEPSASTTARDPLVRMLAQMIEWFTGRPVTCFDGASLQAGFQGDGAGAAPAASALAGPAMPSAAVAMNAARAQSADEGRALRATYRETEQLEFQARGAVNTADGQTIQFSISLQMQRSYSATIDLATAPVAPAPTDPLVINFEGSAAQLSDQRFAFDLDEDGTPDAMRLPTRGSALLVFDRNANGRLDDASELFGPRSGDGFASLAALDADGSGWIDSADPAFARLGVMAASDAPDAAVRSLASQGVGALGTGRIATPFSLKDSGNALLGQVRATGLYLTEQGRVGTVQQVDVVI